MSHCHDVYVYETFRTAVNTLDALLSCSNATISLLYLGVCVADELID